MINIDLVHQLIKVHFNSKFIHDVIDVVTWQAAPTGNVIDSERVSKLRFYVTEMSVAADQVDETLSGEAATWKWPNPSIKCNFKWRRRTQIN